MARTSGLVGVGYVGYANAIDAQVWGWWSTAGRSLVVLVMLAITIK